MHHIVPPEWLLAFCNCAAVITILAESLDLASLLSKRGGVVGQKVFLG